MVPNGSKSVKLFQNNPTRCQKGEEEKNSKTKKITKQHKNAKYGNKKKEEKKKIYRFPSLAPNGSKWLQTTPNGLTWLAMA